MEVKHTTGKWFTGIQKPMRSTSGSIEVFEPCLKVFVKDEAYEDGEKTIALIGDAEKLEAIANGKLMVCAPEMLSLLNDCKFALNFKKGLLEDKVEENYELIQRIQALLNKATK